MPKGKLTALPLTREEANAFVGDNHRHHEPARHDKYRLGAELNGKLVGVVQVGRPKARELQDGRTLEVVRLCTDGTPHVCSFLYGAAARIARELGYTRIITYILEDEPGISLKASGWKFDGMTKGGSWNTPSRPRIDKAPTCKKQRWVKDLRKEA